jgi:MOSC domain-containing protein YiiM
VKRIVRCAATNVNPTTGIRDLHIPEMLQKNFEHGDCGVYAEVIAPGEIALGDKLEAADLFAA